ncbi:MAG: pyridoxine 5'-phosphate synthase [Acidobacteriia bacterium]|nr:pyridoxine 5'-phosphate synthase [Terriglobia bacterium]
MTRLGVNVDHIATLREARKTNEPDPVTAALVAENAGADQITVHLRGDRRHIQDRDVELLREVIKTRLNLEMAATTEMIAFALEVRPDVCTLVPEQPNEITTQGGLNCVAHFDPLKDALRKLHEGGMAVSLFIDPEGEQIEAAGDLKVKMIELNTARYSEASLYITPANEKAIEAEFRKVRAAAEMAAEAGLQVLAGHGLTYRNVRSIVAVGEIEELNIGHNIIARASLVGLDQAVREMIALLK